MASVDMGSDRDQFAVEVAAALRAAGATDLEYDPEEFQFQCRSQDGSPWMAYLGNVFQECADASPDERAARIHRYAAGLVGVRSPGDWPSSAPLLRPVLRSVGYGRGADLPLARDALPFLSELVVVDQPHSMAYVTTNQVRQWGVTESEVFDRARANLASLPSARPPEVGPSDRPAATRLVESGSEYWASQLLADGWLGAWADRIGGRPVAFVPDPTSVLIVHDAPAMIGQLLEMHEKEYLAAARPISPQAYTVDDNGRLVPYSVPVGDPLWNAVHRSETLLAAREYGAQKEELEDSADGFVASLMVAEQPDGGLRSMAVWGDGVDGLLPKADYVAFVGDGSGHFVVPWEIVAKETGLAPEPGWSPARYRARAWPDPATLDRLRAAAIRP